MRQPPKNHLPGEAGIWVFVLGDMSVFALMFGTFLYYRALDVDLYMRSQATLNQHFGAINTLLLLASSWFVVMGVDAARQQRTRAAPGFFGGALLCGFGFATVKFFEYHEKISAGLTLTTNGFYTYYYMLTGLHFAHVSIGLALLGFMWAKSRRPLTEPKQFMLLESGATYWHMVDVLWIVLFPLIYLLK
ncbi:cytochrome c oxidase subunit 3 family protein [Hydrocarboniphaga sp.]|uniref:cytochrome c oxidase subunit 3 family protein n=1 Tax=Hydrocarboniphaga sp. TaxID=2033016 RepID=UPI003D12ECB0